VIGDGSVADGGVAGPPGAVGAGNVAGVRADGVGDAFRGAADAEAERRTPSQ
jgi:hypothetical protein